MGRQSAGMLCLKYYPLSKWNCSIIVTHIINGRNLRNQATHVQNKGGGGGYILLQVHL